MKNIRRTPGGRTYWRRMSGEQTAKSQDSGGLNSDADLMRFALSGDWGMAYGS